MLGTLGCNYILLLHNKTSAIKVLRKVQYPTRTIPVPHHSTTVLQQILLSMYVMTPLASHHFCNGPEGKKREQNAFFLFLIRCRHRRPGVLLLLLLPTLALSERVWCRYNYGCIILSSQILQLTIHFSTITIT